MDNLALCFLPYHVDFSYKMQIALPWSYLNDKLKLVPNRPTGSALIRFAVLV